MKRYLNPRAAFTLIEIMLVVLIIGLLIGLAVHQVGGKLDEATVRNSDIQWGAYGLAVADTDEAAGGCDSWLPVEAARPLHRLVGLPIEASEPADRVAGLPVEASRQLSVP